jgi:hypothetical protein
MRIESQKLSGMNSSGVFIKIGDSVQTSESAFAACPYIDDASGKSAEN